MKFAGMVFLPDTITVVINDEFPTVFFMGKDFNSSVESWTSVVETIKSWINDCEDSDVIAEIFELATGVPCRVVSVRDKDLKATDEVHFGYNIP